MTKGLIPGTTFEEAIVGTVSVKDNITAFATGGQASATLLPAQINRVVTVGSANDSVKLPSAAGAVGAEITVSNAHATNSLNVFPASGDQIDGLGANAAKAVAAGKTATFVSYGGTQWHSMLSA
jgi:hypothetical protein